MSIYQRGDQYIHFIHIPKTGGTSIHQLLDSNGWTKQPDVPLLDDIKNKIHTVKTSKHQHASLWKLWDESVDYRFTMVRNPYERFTSQCKRVAKAEGHAGISPAYVLEKFEYVYNEVIPESGRGADDNHMRPQHEFVDDATHVFRLEDQKHELLESLKEKDIIFSGFTLPYTNVSFEGAPQTIIHWPLLPLLHEQFLTLYGADFDKFGYSKEVPTYGMNIDWGRYAKA